MISRIKKFFTRNAYTAPDYFAGLLPTSAIQPRSAEQLSAVFACADVIASALSSLPPAIYRGMGAEKEMVEDSPLAPLLRCPNRHQTWSDFMLWYVAECLLWGNAIAYQKDGELRPVRWNDCQVDLLPNYRLRYRLRETSSVGGYVSPEQVLMDSMVMHMRDRGDDRFIGRARLDRASDVVKHALAVQASSVGLWDNGAFPSGVLQVPGRLSEDQRKRMQAQIKEQFAGTSNRAKVMLLDNNVTWNKLSVDPDDAQTLQTRQWLTSEICRLYEVPPPLIQDYQYNTFTNASTAGQWFSRFTLASWVKRFEATFSKAMLPEDSYLELDMGAFNRGDLGERWNAYSIALNAGVLSPDEVRRLEGYGGSADNVRPDTEGAGTGGDSESSDGDADGDSGASEGDANGAEEPRP